MPPCSPPVQVKVAGDKLWGGLEKIILAFLKNNVLDKVQFDVHLLPEVIKIVKNLNTQRFNSFRAGNVTVTGLDSESFKMVTGSVASVEKYFIMPFSGLPTFVDALQQVLSFVNHFQQLIKLRDHVLFTQELRLQKVANYNTCHRLLNAARLITLYNEMSALRKFSVPYTFVIGDVINQIKNGVTM